MDMDVDLGLERTIPRRELRVLLLHEFRLGHKATEATSNICGTMGKDALSIHTAHHWFNRFKNGNFELDDLPHSGRPLEVDMEFGYHMICHHISSNTEWTLVWN
jgi:transposase